MSVFLKYLEQVNSWYALIAFVITVVASILTGYINRNIRLITKAPEKDRTALIDKILNQEGLIANGLTKEQKYMLLKNKINQRSYLLILVAFVAGLITLVLISGLVLQPYNQTNSKQEKTIIFEEKNFKPYFRHINQHSEPFIIREWEDSWAFNVSSYECVYAWPKNEKHNLLSNNSVGYYQAETWSIHPLASSKPAEISFVLLSTEPVVINKIYLHLIKAKPAPAIDNFIFTKIDDGCGMGGGSTPRLIFKPLFLSHYKEIYEPKIAKNMEVDSISSLPYQLNANESLSFTLRLFGDSGEYVVNVEIKATDFNGQDYNITTPNVSFKRLVVEEKKLQMLHITKNTQRRGGRKEDK